MINRLVLFGATGDLAGRYLFPALARLHAAGALPADFAIVGAATRQWDDETLQRHTRERLEQHAPEVPEEAREAMVRALRYRRVDFEDHATVAGIIREAARGAAGEEAVAAYLALPPRVYPAAVQALGAARLPRGSRIVVEKPFGEDLESARELNRLLARVAGDEGERAVFRADHVLGLATVQNLLALRLGNRVLEPVWNGAQIETVEILWEETLALENRAGFYDHTGALKDVLQNHMFQLLCLVAMEPPARLEEQALRDRKLEVLRSAHPRHSRRARYGAGRVGARALPAYADERGVDPARGTETFVELELALDAPRWTGTRFVLRAGKALGRPRKEIVLRFRPLAPSPFGDAGAPVPNALRIGIDGPETLTLTLCGGADGKPLPLALTAEPPPSELPAYGRVFLDILRGGSTLSVRGDEAEEAWRVLTPVLEAWAAGKVPLEEYPAGSEGPPG